MINMARLAMCMLLAFIVTGCATQVKTKTDVDAYRKPDRYNLKFIGFDAEIENPSDDRRSYYKIYINKAEEGRTTTGLESQEKTFETLLPPNRHLIVVEKWVLDQKSGRYVKLNNIDQPKPNFIYFTLPAKKIVIIEMKTVRDGAAEFRLDYEKE
jgi:hypothetical protein